MTPDEFKNIRENLTLTGAGAAKYGMPLSSKISQSVLAKILGVKNDRTIRKWEEGANDISDTAIVIMKAITQVPEFCEYLGVVFNPPKN